MCVCIVFTHSNVKTKIFSPLAENYADQFALLPFAEIQRKPINDIFDSDSHMMHSEPKLAPIDTAALNAKWKAAQAARYDKHFKKNCNVHFS